MFILPDASRNAQHPAVDHPSWCDPRDCQLRDRRLDGLGLLLVHALIVWTGHLPSRRLQLIQTQTLTTAGAVHETHRPVVIAHGDLSGGMGPTAAADLAAAWTRAAHLGEHRSLPVTPRLRRLAEQLDPAA